MTDYQAVNDTVLDLYGEGRYSEALDVVDAAAERFPDRSADLAYQAACLLAVTGRPADALARLVAAETNGDWWHPRLLLEDGDLAEVREQPGFGALLERSTVRSDVAQAEVTAPLVEAPDDPHGLLVVLHGADQTAAEAFARWRAALDAGFVLVAVESSQRNTPSYRSWPDPVIGDRDVARAYRALPEGYDGLPLVVAGFSAGGRQALRWALAGAPGRPNAFVVVAPAVSPDRLPDPVEAVARGCTGVVLLGDSDDDVGPDAEASYRRLRTRGWTCGWSGCPGWGTSTRPTSVRGCGGSSRPRA